MLARAETTVDSAVARAVTRVDSAAVRAATNANFPEAHSETIASSSPAVRAVTVARAPAKGVGEPDPDEIRPGTQLGYWTITHRLGQGGMGAVYAATEADIGTTVAVKVLAMPDWRNPNLREEFEKAKERFLREARAASRLKHPNVIGIHAYDNLPDGRPFFVMEYLPGRSLDVRLREDPPGSSELARLLCQVCDALTAIHLERIVHRDLKPENIWIVEPKTGDSFVKVLDFGISKMADARKLTKTRGVIGTPFYLSPEQLKGGEIDHRSDIYSFGVVLYEVFTGQVPFVGESEWEVFAKLTSEEPPPPVARDGGPIPRELERLILDCLKKNPEQRPQSALELKERLQSALARDVSGATSTRGIVPLPTRVSVFGEGAATADIVASVSGGRRHLAKVMVGVLAVALAVATYLGLRRSAEVSSPVAIPAKAAESAKPTAAAEAPKAPAEIPPPTSTKGSTASDEPVKAGVAARTSPTSRRRSALRGGAPVQPSESGPRSTSERLSAAEPLAPPPPPPTSPAPAASPPTAAVLPLPPTEAAPSVRGAHQPALPQKPELIYKDLRTEK